MTCYVCGPRECAHEAPLPRTCLRSLASPRRLTDEEANAIVLPSTIKLSPRAGTAGYLTGFKWLPDAFASYLRAMGSREKWVVRHDPEPGGKTTKRFNGWTCGCIDRRHPCDRHAMAVRDYKPKVIYVRELDRRRGAGRRKGDQKKSRKAA